MAEITDKIRKVVSTTAIQKNGPGHTSVWSDADDLLWVNVAGTKKKILTTSDETSEVNGPGSSTDNAVARWDGTTGTLIQNSVVVISDTGAVSGVISITGSGGQVLDVSTADVTTLARSTNLQEFRIGPSGDYLSFQKGTGSGFIQTFGTDNLNFGVNNTQYWRLEGTTGHFGAVTDNVNDIGASGANRPRTLYAGTSVVTPLIGTGGTLNYIGIQKDDHAGVALDVATDSTLKVFARDGSKAAIVQSRAFLNDGVAFASLPTGIAGMTAYVTDSNTATWGATIAGGGANRVLAFYNGTNWTVAGK